MCRGEKKKKNRTSSKLTVCQEGEKHIIVVVFGIEKEKRLRLIPGDLPPFVFAGKKGSNDVYRPAYHHRVEKKERVRHKVSGEKEANAFQKGNRWAGKGKGYDFPNLKIRS